MMIMRIIIISEHLMLDSWFIMVLTPYLHVYGVRVCFIFLSDVFDVVKGGSRSHLLVGIYTMHHSLPFPV